MERNIFEVYAKIIDANGSYNTLSGYPKVFDSRSYNNDVSKTLQRARGEFHETFGAMCKRDDRKMQMVLLMTAMGQVIDCQHIGMVPPEPEPESQPEPEPEPQPDNSQEPDNPQEPTEPTEQGESE